MVWVYITQNFGVYYIGIIVYGYPCDIDTNTTKTASYDNIKHKISIIVFLPVTAPPNDLYTQRVPNESEQPFEIWKAKTRRRECRKERRIYREK